MKTIFHIVLVAFVAFFFRVEIAKLAIDAKLKENKEKIEFVGTLLPVYCQVESIQQNFRTSNDFVSFANNIKSLNEDALPSLKYAIQDIKTYNAESEDVKNSLSNLYEKCADGSNKMNGVIRSYEEIDGFWSLLRAGFNTINFISEAENINKGIQYRKNDFDNNMANYIKRLSIEVKQDQIKNAFEIGIFNAVLSRKDIYELKIYLNNEIIEGIQQSCNRNNSCSMSQLQNIKEQVL